MSYGMEKVVEHMNEFGDIVVGGFYQAPGDPHTALDGIVQVTDIRRWDDGMLDVELKDPTSRITNYVLLEPLLGNDPATKEPIFKRVEPTQ